MKLTPETLEAHKARQRERHSRPTPAGFREATDEEKLAYLTAVSHGFTRGLFRDVPLDELPLYHNGDDFYMLTGVKVGSGQGELPV